MGAMGVAGCKQPESTRLEETPLPHVRAATVSLVEPRARSRHLVALQPARESRLAPRAGGQIIALQVRDQQEVTEGEVLVRFAGADPRGGLISAKASIDRIKENLRDTDSELEDSRALVERGAESTRAVERLETQQAQLQAQLEEARGQLMRARDRVGATTIIAPFDGTITSLDAEVGEYMNPGTAVAVLAQLDPMAVEVPLTQEEVRRHDDGGLSFEVTIRDRMVEPELEWIATAADPATATFPARLLIDNEARTLRAGELVEVRVFAQKKMKVKAVPATAIRWAADDAYVLKLDEGKLRRVDVKVLDDTEALVIIEGDLPVGARVVSSGPTALADGDEVQVVDGPAPTLASG